MARSLLLDYNKRTHKLHGKEKRLKKILGLIGSPRKLGNCEILAKEIGRRIGPPHRLLLIRLSDFSILPCTGCYRCLEEDKRCVLGDDLYRVLDPLADADALIVAVPAYFLGPKAVLKTFLDRGLAFYPYADRLLDKPAVGVGVAGIPGKEGYTLLAIESFLKLIFSDMKASRILYGALPGEIFLDEGNLEAATQLADALFSPTRDPRGPRCPVCGGRTFRFLGDRRVRCMLCSNEGTAVMGDDAARFDIQRSEHEIFLSREDLEAHQAWLLGMKNRYREKKGRLKKICLSYLKDGEWIR
jgi:multimeric flavodoxin WrbA